MAAQAEADKKTAKIERAQIKRAAGDIKEASGQLAHSADRTTQLAADRTLYAAERTYAAWVRTGLAALAGGVGAKALLAGVLPVLAVRLAGSVLILFSGFCFYAAVWRQMFPPVPPPMTDTRRVPRRVLYAANAALILVALAALVGIWAR